MKKLLAVLLLLLILGFAYLNLSSKPINIEVNLNKNNELVISYDKYKPFVKTYCLNSDKEPKIDADWVISKNNTCILPFNESNIYIKYGNKILKVENYKPIGKLKELKFDTSKIYLAIDDQFKLNPIYDILGTLDINFIYEVLDENIASVSEEGVVTGLTPGNTSVKVTANNKETNVDIIVTNLIVKKPNSYNTNKSFLSCDLFSKEQNDLLDEILEDRVNTAGYKTRGGVIAAARFITLEFPYKISYYSENGRMAFKEYKVDGEGRYYHKGLYLHSSRYSNIKYVAQGPKEWGCYMYNIVTEKPGRNGLDCSGYITWVLYNAGFDPGDVGAGVSHDVFDLTDTGERVKFTKERIIAGDVKVGDLLSSEGPEGGHIALILGEDNDYYYVTESLWTGSQTGVTIVAYNKDTIMNRYYYVILMDDYYKEEGIYTKHWSLDNFT